MSDSFQAVECSECGRFMNVSYSASGGTCSACTQKHVMALMTDSERDKLFGIKSSNGRVVRPRGWKWMAEFVDNDGTVWHKGVAQPDLKGKRPITDIEVLREKRKSAKKTTRVKEQKELLTMAAEKKELKKAMAAQKDFLNHNIGGKNA